MRLSISEVLVRTENDMVLARQHVKQIGRMAGLSLEDQTRFMAAASEILRNAIQYAGGAKAEFAVLSEGTNSHLELTIRDNGAGISNLDDILKGKHKSGLGILSARRLVDRFSIESSPEEGTCVSLAKQLPDDGAKFTKATVQSWAKQLTPAKNADALQELQEQTRQLLQALDDAQKYKLELEHQLLQVKQLNLDLEQTNQGIMALYKELDERSAKLEQQSEELKVATRHKSEFLANMSHEIRTPMNGVLGMTEVLLKSGLTDKQREYAITIRDAGKSLLSIINDILDLSKIEAGKLTLDVDEFEPVRLVEDIAELLNAQAKQNGLSLLSFIDPDLPLVLRGDAGRIRQILVNFVGNAVKFSERGSILLRTTLESSNGQVATVKFVVTDPGIGMTDQEIQKLFEPFSQADSSSTRKYGGTGLGLSISKRLVELMGGEIGVTSVKGHGSTFWFLLPLAIGSPRAAKHSAPADLSGMRVLIVDDDPQASEIISAYIASWGMKPTAVSSAKQALSEIDSALRSNPYHLAIVDLVMPEVDGMQLAKSIREDKSLSKMELILVTAFDKPGIGQEAIQLGYDAYLTKPIRQSRLLDAITTVLHKSELQLLATSGTQEAASSNQTTNHHTSRPELILVAEDHLINQQVAILLLRNLGFESHVAANGRKVVETFQRSQYSLIFMDCQMPEMDGFETTRTIRKIEATSGKHIPIVAMTAHAIEGSREQCLAAGMDDYISKPIEIEQLKLILDKWLPISAAESVSLPVNLTEMKSRYGEEHIRQFLGLFLTEAPQQIEKLQQFIHSHDVPQILNVAHSLKGICGVMYAEPMRQLCIEIEATVLHSDRDTLAALGCKLESEFERLQLFLRETDNA